MITRYLSRYLPSFIARSLSQAGAGGGGNPELIVNGDFANGTTAWVARPGDATQSVVAGELEVVAISGAGQVTEQLTIAVEVGVTYEVSGTMRADAANTGAQTCRIDIIGPGLLFRQVVAANGVQTPITGSFVATNATIDVQLGVANAGAWGSIGDKAYFDNISVRRAV